jgi:hypothetical protein
MRIKPKTTRPNSDEAGATPSDRLSAAQMFVGVAPALITHSACFVLAALQDKTQRLCNAPCSTITFTKGE